MSLFSCLNRAQKESVALFQLGTFLEYFDLMLYVFMSILLNDLFFPKTGKHTTALLTALAFCSLYIMKPLGTFFFEWLGDHIGRDATVNITSVLSALSCLMLANLPTYNEIGLLAVWGVTLCRLIQGFASMGERVGAELFIVEATKPPETYPLAVSISLFGALGLLGAVTIASVTTLPWYDWRIAFWFGTILAVGGAYARTRLREVPDLVDMKRRMKKTIEDAESGGFTRAANLFKKTNPLWSEKIPKTTLFALFAIHSLSLATFYFAFIYCGDILRFEFGYTAAQVIHQNLGAAVALVFSSLVVFSLSRRFHPFTILRGQMLLFTPLILLSPFILTTPLQIGLVQCFLMLFIPAVTPASVIFYSHIPIFKRFATTNLLYMWTQAIVAVVFSFGLASITAGLSYGGSFIIMTPLTMSFVWGVWYFERLERTREALCQGNPVSQQDKVA